jgi:hypothetical protein
VVIGASTFLAPLLLLLLLVVNYGAVTAVVSSSFPAPGNHSQVTSKAYM